MVEEVPPQIINGIAVSSSKIRKALLEGDLSRANMMLGYDYSLTGTVTTGLKLGTKMGFPTANIRLEDDQQLIAGEGVYACKVLWHGNEYYGMGSIGTRPTFNRKELAIEVNIFNFNHEIYGEEITIYWIEKIRDEVRFDNMDQLRRQLTTDRETVLRIFGRT
jgi:riboflavin kinase/FMN adenylyltransferase